jgi:hypothetical protein
MATITLILKNTTGSPISINDLGVYVPSNNQINVTQLFASNRSEPIQSIDLANQILAGNVVVNNGTSDLSAADAAKYLSYYMVAGHTITGHSGNMSESMISVDGILARTNSPASITGAWQIGSGGKLILDNGNTLPSGSIETARAFWKTDTKSMHMGSGGVWNDVLVTQNTRYNAPVVYEFGYSSQISSGSYLRTAWSVSTSTPVIVPLNGTLKAMCASSSTSNSYTCAIKRYDGSNWSTSPIIASVTSASGGYVSNNTLSVNFSAQDRLACLVSAGRMGSPHCYIEVIWRI